MAGVDRSSVSLVLNNPETTRVGAEAKRRILDAVEATGYAPDSAAKQLREGTSRTVLMPFPSYPFGPTFDHLIEGLADGAENAGLTFLMHGSHRATGAPAARAWAALNPQIFIGEHTRVDADGLETLRRSGAHSVLLFGEDAELDGATTISMHMTEPGRIAAVHLLARGFDRLAVVAPSDPRLATIADARVDGFLAEAATHGVSADAFRVDESDDALRAALAQILELGPRVGVFVYSDRYALPLISMAGDLGIDIPGRIGVVGVDDVPAARSARPALSSISYDPVAFGAALIAYALDHETARHDIPAPAYRLTERASS